MGTTVLMFLDCIVLLLQFTTLVCNGTFLFLHSRITRNEKFSFLRVSVFLSATNFLNALATIPYAVYLITNWNAARIDLNPYYVLILGTPIPAHLKVNITLTISLALERTLALYFPVGYRRLSSPIYAIASLVIGLLLAAFDLFVEFTLTSFEPKVDCPALWCFLNDRFCSYWGVSNLALSLVVVVLTVIFVVKLRLSRPKPHVFSTSIQKDSGRSTSVQANRISMGILFTSLIFVTFPSIIAGVAGIRGDVVMNSIGPFYFIGLLCSGTCTSVVYMTLNRDLRIALKNCLLCNCSASGPSGTSVEFLSSYRSRRRPTQI
ncbi:hypothetical protein COOONC_10491 [Cooperia oncophora]